MGAITVNTSSPSSVGILSNTFPLIHSSVPEWKKAKIIVFLINHKKKDYYPTVHNAIQNIENKSNAILLFESPSEHEKWNSLEIETECWEDKDLIAKIKIETLSFHKLRDELNKLTDQTLLISLKEEIILSLQALSKKWNTEILDCTDVLERLKETSLRSLEELKKEMIEWLNKIFRNFKNQIVKSTMEERQTGLIKKIQDHLIKSNLFVICGSCHGHIEKSNFPKQAERLIDFLNENGSYALMDCTT
ncbi:hypothetical protein [Criblamydia sequanensis]|uniref:Uncharacterized protein n=1 Tax=Candidatus Criblamydia sequanensis CRIB-18 TaxID=1437425 RepID=A0A090CYX8_9BACT|nr:hypothetical protein [Criblamydia sequanensis]CDR34002.1 hypothetical protein CSEC_1178 [Criblamydia sequanensis CRIB-18]